MFTNMMDENHYSELQKQQDCHQTYQNHISVNRGGDMNTCHNTLNRRRFKPNQVDLGQTLSQISLVQVYMHNKVKILFTNSKEDFNVHEKRVYPDRNLMEVDLKVDIGKCVSNSRQNGTASQISSTICSYKRLGVS